MIKVLLTGGSGFIASHVLRILLDRGHSVITTVRSQAKADHIKSTYFDVSSSRLDFAIVEDISAENAYDEVMKSASFEAVIHIASPFQLWGDDIKKTFMDPAILGTTGLLEAVKAYAPTVNRVVITSSLATADVVPVKPSYVHSAKDWVEVSEEKAYSNPWDGYVASKVYAEKAAWNFVKRENPKFTITTILPAFVLGPIIHDVGSLDTIMTSGLLIRDFLSGNYKDEIAPSPIGRFTDVREPLWHTGTYSNRQVATILRKNFSALQSKLPGPEFKSGDFPVGGVPDFDVEPSKKILGMVYATLEDTICFFCQATRNHQNSATAVLRGIIWSLAHQHPALVSHVRSEFDSAGEQAFNGPNNWEILSSILRRMVSDSSSRVPDGTTIVIDALDECTKDNKKLLDLIVHFCASKESRVRWIVSSRNWVEFQDAFVKKVVASQQVIVSLEDNEEAEESINNAVDAFIEYKVGELERIKETKLEAEVHIILAEKSSSTFLWVALACQRLLSSDIDDWQIFDTLKGFPSSLKELYRRMLQEVKDSGHASQCRDILAVATLVHRPLSLRELSSSAQSLSQHSSRLDALKKQVLRCKGFLVVTDDVVSFMHQSAKDFLLEDMLAREFIWEAEKEEKLSESILRGHHTILMAMLETMKKTLKYDIYDLKKPGADVLYLDRKGRSYLDIRRQNCVCYPRIPQNISTLLARGLFATWKGADCTGHSKAEGSSGMSPFYMLCVPVLTESQIGTEYHKLISVLRDVNRFALYFKGAIEQFPLQIYVSGLLFCPRTSLARQAFIQHTPETSWLNLPISEDWDACVQTLEGHKSTVSNIAFSGNGQWLASTSHDCTIRIWDVATGVCLQIIHSTYVEVHAVAFSSDSSCLAAASENCAIELWDTKSEEFIKTQTVDTRGTVIIGLAFSPDDEWLASWSYEPKVQIRNAKTGDCIYKIVGCEWTNYPEIHPEWLLTSAFSSEGTWVGHAFGEHGHSIWTFSEADSHRVVDLLRDDGYALPSSGQYPAGRPLPTPQRPSAISNDGKQIATCTEYPFRLAIADTTTGAVAFAHPRTATGAGNGLPMVMAWSADSQWLAVGGVGTNGQIGIWDPKAIKDGSGTDEIRKRIKSMAFSTDGRRFASGSEDGIIEIMDMARPGNSLLTLEGHDSAVYAIVFSPSGKMLATQCAFLVKIWNIEASGECVHTFQAVQIDLRLAITCHWSMAFSTDDSKFAFSQGEHAIEVHDLADQSIYELESEYVSCLVFSPDGLSLAAGDMHGTVKV
ncbi:hypothetical protein BFJ72_g7516 [Fusarium proliferatum]|uniref:NAD-dependent epimerase/dehydratase domain-containing protein n=1 Tax=Gibberella intermedia TaxID=948311 RepID=A0A420T944_GIBIN|nr:hypothetical protein BFJ72_g7516 [Fusarium proliferatum]